MQKMSVEMTSVVSINKMNGFEHKSNSGHEGMVAIEPKNVFEKLLKKQVQFHQNHSAQNTSHQNSPPYSCLLYTSLLTGNENIKKQSMGGIKVAADIMNFMGGESEASLMEGLKSYDEDMAQQIMDEMFVFDNIMDVDDKGIQALLREVQSETLIVALKGTTEEMRDKIFRNMSSRAAEMMKEDLETKGPVKLSEVEAQQKQILQIVRRLADEGQIMLAGKGEDDKYV